MFDKEIISFLIPLIHSNFGNIWQQSADIAGNGGLQALIAIAGIAVGWRFHHKQTVACSTACLGGLTFSGVLVQLLKFAIGRARPVLGLPPWTFRPWATPNNWHSFPSGHAASSFTIATVISLFYPRLWWLWYCMAAFIGMGRVIGESNYPTDVLAGALLGCLCGGLAFQIINRYFHKISNHPE